MHIIDDPLWRKYLEAGFKSWQSESIIKLKNTPYFLQKQITKDKIILFFITVYVYDFNGEIDYRPEANFNVKIGQNPTFSVIYMGKGNPAEVEIFFRTIYRAMHCEPYER